MAAAVPASLACIPLAVVEVARSLLAVAALSGILAAQKIPPA